LAARALLKDLSTGRKRLHDAASVPSKKERFIMIKFVAMGLLGVFGFGASVGAPAVEDAAPASDADMGDAVELGTSCNGVEIKVINDKTDQIKVTKISYQVDGKGTSHSEDLSDKEIGKNGGSHTWNNQNLQHAPAGSKLTFKVFFKNDKAGGWGNEVSQEFDRLGSSCTDGRDYSFTIK
jgi:hypothetical protein